MLGKDLSHEQIAMAEREREEKENRGWNRQGLGDCFISFGSYSKGNKKIWEEFKQGIDLTMSALGWEWKEVGEIR